MWTIVKNKRNVGPEQINCYNNYNYTLNLFIQQSASSYHNYIYFSCFLMSFIFMPLLSSHLASWFSHWLPADTGLSLFLQSSLSQCYLLRLLFSGWSLKLTIQAPLSYCVSTLLSSLHYACMCYDIHYRIFRAFELPPHCDVVLAKQLTQLVLFIQEYCNKGLVGAGRFVRTSQVSPSASVPDSIKRTSLLHSVLSLQSSNLSVISTVDRSSWL